MYHYSLHFGRRCVNKEKPTAGGGADLSVLIAIIQKGIYTWLFTVFAEALIILVEGRRDNGGRARQY